MSIKYDPNGVKVAFLGGFADNKVSIVQQYDTSKKLTWVRDEEKPRKTGLQNYVSNGTPETEQYSLLVLSKNNETKMFYVHESETLDTIQNKISDNEVWKLSSTIGYSFN